MMVHCPGWEDGVRQARATPTLGVGLHFNLLVGSPLTAAASLRNARGEFLSLGALVRKTLRGAIRDTDVTAECEARTTPQTTFQTMKNVALAAAKKSAM